MTTPRIRTWAESSNRWWLIVGENANEVRFGPHKKAGQTKTAEDFLRRLAARDGWKRALEPGSLQAFMEAPPASSPLEHVGVPDPATERPAWPVGVPARAIVEPIREHRPPQAPPWPVGCVT